jgi:hypothetical protein
LRVRQLPMTLHWYTFLAICPTRLTGMTREVCG